MFKEKTRQVISASFLISGTSIGAGMLALPIATGPSGFLPTLASNFICWLFMLLTGLLFAEVVLWMPERTNLLSMSEKFLGKFGKLVGGCVFLFLYYCLMVAYISGLAPSISGIFQLLFSWEINHNQSAILSAFLFTIFIAKGQKFIGKFNLCLMIGLIISYLSLIITAQKEMVCTHFTSANWSVSMAPLPILFGAYGYHNVIPSISTYLKKDHKLLKRAIVLGSLTAFIVYSIWQSMIIGILTQKELEVFSTKGLPITVLLKEKIDNPFIVTFALFFGFFALITSLVGVSLSMMDFLKDGFQKKKEGFFTNILFSTLVYLPALILALLNPSIFQTAMGYAGGFGEAILNGFFPIFMVIAGIYGYKKSLHIHQLGSWFLLISLFLFTLLIIAIEVKEVFQ